MAENARGGDGMAAENVVDEIQHGMDLWSGIGRQAAIRRAEIMPAIDDLYADGAGVQILLSLPAGDACMPGALVLFDELRDAAIFPDHVVRRDFCLQNRTCAPARLPPSPCRYSAAPACRAGACAR